jgi:3-deoxy-D-manno-octulosonic-acid transferase
VRATVDSGEGDELSSHFANGYFTLIAGSTWPEDEKLLAEALRAHPGIKLIVAPHEVARPNVSRLRRLFDGTASLYSEGIAASYDARVLIIDNVGLLSKIYRSGSLAYVGGGFSGKLHNILEPAAFGLPVIFGPKFNDFPEAVEMIGIGAGYTVKGIDDLNRVITRFKEGDHLLKAAGREAREFVNSNVGGTTPVVEEVKACLDQS